MRFPSRAAFSLARTRAASASRSDAASFAAMEAMVSGLCGGGGGRSPPAGRGSGRRELMRRGERLDEGGEAGRAGGGGMSATVLVGLSGAAVLVEADAVAVVVGFPAGLAAGCSFSSGARPCLALVLGERASGC
jgi:hypothetical protein